MQYTEIYKVTQLNVPDNIYNWIAKKVSYPVVYVVWHIQLSLTLHTVSRLSIGSLGHNGQYYSRVRDWAGLICCPYG